MQNAVHVGVREVAKEPLPRVLSCRAAVHGCLVGMSGHASSLLFTGVLHVGYNRVLSSALKAAVAGNVSLEVRIPAHNTNKGFETGKKRATNLLATQPIDAANSILSSLYLAQHANLY